MDRAEPDYRFWVERETWTLIQAACLLAGHSPIEEQKFEKDLSTGGPAAIMYFDLKNATIEGTIPFREVGGLLQRRRVTARSAVQWASELGKTIPERLKDVVASLEPRASGDAAESAQRRERGLFTVEEVASTIAAKQGWHDSARDSLRRQLVEAARSGVLIIRHPHTELPHRPDVVRDFYDLVTVADVNQWLQSVAAPYRLNTEHGAAENSDDRPRQRSAVQDAAILRTITQLGHDPTALPKNKRGKPGVKAAVRAKLSDAMWQGTVFNKAWDRLRKTGAIRDKADPM
jgi:hypothetical protein